MYANCQCNVWCGGTSHEHILLSMTKCTVYMPGSGEGLVENHGCLEWKFYGGMLERDRELGLKSKTYRFLYLLII